MKYIFVGDLHGRYEVIERALDKDHDRIVFVGDIFDSFDRSVKDQFKTFYMVKKLVEEDRADCLWANHEWSYLDARMRCSGFNDATFARRHEFESTVRNVFKPYLILGKNILVTHAGLTNRKYDLSSIIPLDKLDTSPGSAFFDIGRIRGGNSALGGPLWCDFNHEFEPIPGLIQIFGHTHGQGIRLKGDNFCIDCVDNTLEFLTMDI